MNLQLSVLDQSPVSAEMSAETALANTVTLAKHVESLGFKRFWVSEHHDSDRLAGSSPEVLIATIAAKTNNIRVGSGGVMLPHYSPYKVAETFKVLEGLNPGRIDLGLGRAPGGMPLATMALQEGKRQQYHDHYPEQIDDLLHFLHNEVEKGHRFDGLKATPTIKTSPHVWLLGSSPSSALLAAQKGLPYGFAQFINGEGGNSYTELYRQRFTPSFYLSEPKNLVAVFTVCAEQEKEAEGMAASLDLALLRNEQGIRLPLASPEEALTYNYSPYEKERVKANRKRMIVGTPKQVKEKFIQLSEAHQTNEIVIVGNVYDFEAKLKMFELIADEILG
jgi:luciferase family oxidoreductase group 1